MTGRAGVFVVLALLAPVGALLPETTAKHVRVHHKAQAPEMPTVSRAGRGRLLRDVASQQIPRAMLAGAAEHQAREEGQKEAPPPGWEEEATAGVGIEARNAQDPLRSATCLKKLWPQAHVRGCPAHATRSAQSNICECAPGYCGEADGQCHEQLTGRTGFDFRMAPRANQNMFLRAEDSDQNPVLRFVPGWPADGQTDAVWNMLVQPDSRAVLISTQRSWAMGSEARVLDIDKATMEPRMSSLQAAGQAEFRLVQAGAGQGHRVFLKHLRTGYYLAVADPHWGHAARPAVGSPDAEPVPVHAPEMSVSPDPTPGAAFDLWPPDVIQLLAAQGLLDVLPGVERAADALSAHLQAVASTKGFAPLRHPLLVILASILVIGGVLAGAAARAAGNIDDRSLFEKAKGPLTPAAVRSKAVRQ